MASTIKLKNGSGAPLASDLVQGEPALDLTNKRLYTEDSLGTVIEVGTNPTEIQIDNINIDGNAITSTDTNGNIAITPDGTGEVDISKVDIDGGAIDGTVIGGTTTAAGSFTTLQADTSLNVDGTVTADGLTVDGAVNVNGTVGDIVKIATTAGNADLWLTDTDTSAGQVRVRGDANSLKFITDTKVRHTIDSNGDISFYEDTGVTPKMVWDSSAESLLLGSPTSWGSGHSLVVGSGGSVGGSQGALFVGKYDGSLTSGNEAGRIDFGGSADETLGASISAEADATWTHSTSHPTRLLFKTTGSGSATPTERMRLDASGNLGIGCTPSENLSISTSGNTQDVSIQLLATNSVGNQSNGAKIKAIGSASNNGLGTLTFETRRSNLAYEEAMRIDSSGNVGIGTSPATNFHVENDASTSEIIRIGSSTVTHDTGIYMRTTGTAGISWGTGGALAFYGSGAGGAERMRIDSSGNLLVGRTSTGSSAVSGIEAHSDGYTQITRSAASTNPTLHVGKLTNDGEIVRFTKDGASVGSIGTRAGYLKIGTANTGLLFNSGSSQIYPENPDGGALRDAAIDLGTSSSRFKDLYLSGGVYFGGTGSANFLDDYEEGTFTPTVVGSTTAGSYTVTPTNCRYTKIGRLVTVTGKMAISVTTAGTGIAKFGGLPFTSLTNSYGQGNVRLQNCDTTAGLNLSIAGWTSNSTDFFIVISQDNASSTSVQASELSSSTTVEITYQYEAS